MKVEGAKNLKELLKISGGVILQKNMILFLVMLFFSGAEISFYSGEFPLFLHRKSIGAIMTALGVAEVVGGFSFGKISDYIGKKAVMLLGCIIYVSALWLSWGNLHYFGQHEYLWYVIAACFGLGKQ